MPAVDSTALTALGQTIVTTVDFVWIDFVGTPVRACTWYDDIMLSGTGDSELDGIYEAIDPVFLDLGEIEHGAGGSSTATISLSGIVGVDTTVLNIIGDRTKWHRRTVRLWMRVHDESGTQQGAIVPYYTGFMVDARIVPRPDSQTIEIQVENYLSLLSGASHRTYMDQADFDSADQSAKATLAAANGAKTGPAATIGLGSGGAGSGGVFGGADRRLVAPY